MHCSRILEVSRRCILLFGAPLIKFVGLLTNIGMVVANPAYDSNTTLIDVLNRAAYHGTVVW